MKKYFLATVKSLLLLTVGITIIVTGEFIGYYGIPVYLEEYKYYFGLSFIILAILPFYYTMKKNKTEYSKCPKCKETYFYSELKDGICPKCDIKTVDIDEYYEK